MAKETQSELKAKDLLPPDSPPPDDSLKKIAERRVVGWILSDLLVKRAERRPVGNSREFWKKIEDDDPFIPRRVPRRLREDHTLYPADRIDRIPADQGYQPPPKPAAARGSAPPSAPQPKRAAAPAVNRDPRAAKPPEHMRPPPPPPPEEAEGVEVEGRMMPPIFAPPGQGKKKTGRIKVSSASGPPSPRTGIVRPSAEEIRAEKAAGRKVEEAPVVPKLKSLDQVLGLLGKLKAQEELHEKGIDVGAMVDDDDDLAPRPKPKRVAKPAAAEPAPPRPAPATPPLDRTPPKAKATPKDDPPMRPASAGGLNDLFGGGPSEGRTRIGKRTKPAEPKPE